MFVFIIISAFVFLYYGLIILFSIRTFCVKLWDENRSLFVFKNLFHKEGLRIEKNRFCETRGGGRMMIYMSSVPQCIEKLGYRGRFTSNKWKHWDILCGWCTTSGKSGHDKWVSKKKFDCCSTVTELLVRRQSFPCSFGQKKNTRFLLLNSFSSRVLTGNWSCLEWTLD